MAKKTKDTTTLTKEQFVILAIERLRKDGYKGIHCRYSGFNDAFRAHFGEGSDPVAATTELANSGKIVTRFVKGGVMLYKVGESPAVPVPGSAALGKMGLA